MNTTAIQEMKPDAAHAEILVDGVRQDEDERPQQHPRCEVQRAGDAEQVPLQRLRAERGLEREDLDADELGR